jgi:hypothetical protein
MRTESQSSADHAHAFAEYHIAGTWASNGECVATCIADGECDTACTANGECLVAYNASCMKCSGSEDGGKEDEGMLERGTPWMYIKYESIAAQ